MQHSATELLEEARRLDVLIRAAMVPDGDIRGTVERLGKQLVSDNTGLEPSQADNFFTILIAGFVPGANWTASTSRTQPGVQVRSVLVEISS